MYNDEKNKAKRKEYKIHFDPVSLVLQRRRERGGRKKAK